MRYLLIFVALAASAQDRPLHLSVRAPAPARFYLEDSSGKSHFPRGAITYERGAERHFVVSSGFEIDLPPGTYKLVAERGPEYRPFRATVDRSMTVDAAPARWIDMNRLGWYSGDLHNHRRVEEMPLLLLAEDLNLAPTLADWIWEDRPNSMPPLTGATIRPVDATHIFSVFDKEVERLRAGPGAVDLLGLRMRLPFDGYLLYPPSDTFARQAHVQGAWVDAEKIVWRDTAALVALGLVDFAGVVNNHFNRHGVIVETDPWGMIPKQRPEYDTPAGLPLWFMDVYYRYLNCGFRLPVSAGAASGVMASPLGYARVYVKVDGPFGYETWFHALKAGRSFGTNGPILFFTVDAREPGAVLQFGEKSPHRVRIHAEASSLNPLDRLEVIYKGKTIRTVTGEQKLVADLTAEVGETGWLAARAFEKPGQTVRFAQTSPVYVEFPGDSGIVSADAQFFLDWMDREMAYYRTAPGFREPAHREAMLTLFASARAVYARLAQR